MIGKWTIVQNLNKFEKNVKTIQRTAGRAIPTGIIYICFSGLMLYLNIHDASRFMLKMYRCSCKECT